MKYYYYKYYTDFTRFCRFFLNIISFQNVVQFGIGRSQIEYNMKVKIGISICTGLMLNDHSNPCIESTTVLSDIDCNYNFFHLQKYNIHQITKNLCITAMSVQVVPKQWL